MTTMASQITSLTVVYSTVYSDADKKNIKAPRHWPLGGEFTGTGEFPAQRASYTENVSIWWRHHNNRHSYLAYCVYCEYFEDMAWLCKTLNLIIYYVKSILHPISISNAIFSPLQRVMDNDTKPSPKYMINMITSTYRCCQTLYTYIRSRTFA